MDNGLSQLHRLTKKDRKRACQVLGRAFADYPLCQYFIRDESRRWKFAEAFASVAYIMCEKYGEAYSPTGDMEAVAGWLPPGKAPFTMWQVLTSVPIPVLFRFGMNAGAGMKAAGDYIDMMHRKLVPQPHWYLQIIGVEPDCQGQGYSGKLIRPMLERTDAEGLPCFLETNTEKNAGIYQRFGFKVISETKIPGTDLISWDMLREVGG